MLSFLVLNLCPDLDCRNPRIAIEVVEDRGIHVYNYSLYHILFILLQCRPRLPTITATYII